jgi:hypothetical protein
MTNAPIETIPTTWIEDRDHAYFHLIAGQPPSLCADTCEGIHR